MPRTLYLLRHAQSADKQHGQTDQQRILTPTGMKQALQIGAFFRGEKTSPDIIISSTAERAVATATIVADALMYDRDRILCRDELYEASTRTLLEFVTQLDDKHQQVLCVAHNPGITYIAEYLTKAEIGEMVPAGMAIIEFDETSWREISAGTGSLVRYIYD